MAGGQIPASPQVIGSALTYARRYTLFALAGIAGEGEDDDGNAASGKDGMRPTTRLIDRDQLVQVQSLLEATKSKQELFFKAIGCRGFSDMTVKQWKDGMARLREKQRGREGGCAMTDAELVQNSEDWLQARCGSVGASMCPTSSAGPRQATAPPAPDLMALKSSSV